MRERISEVYMTEEKIVSNFIRIHYFIRYALRPPERAKSEVRLEFFVIYFADQFKFCST